uniref:Uncharacterized protein n=1 Tax=viral metagenome TaxID=1070528 RepID=A0A6M3JFG7_9ZZZZ
MTTIMRKIIIVTVFIVLAFCVGYVYGHIQGKDDGTRQMARHILNPKFRTQAFDQIVKEETN